MVSSRYSRITACRGFVDLHVRRHVNKFSVTDRDIALYLAIQRAEWMVGGDEEGLSRFGVR